MGLLESIVELKDTAFEPKTAKVELPRLSETYGNPFILKLRSLTVREFDMFKNMGASADPFAVFTASKIISTKDDGTEVESTFGDLKEHFKAKTPEDAVLNRLNKGEMTFIVDRICLLSGFGKTSIKVLEQEVAKLVKKP